MSEKLSLITVDDLHSKFQAPCGGRVQETGAGPRILRVGGRPLAFPVSVAGAPIQGCTTATSAGSLTCVSVVAQTRGFQSKLRVAGQFPLTEAFSAITNGYPPCPKEVSRQATIDGIVRVARNRSNDSPDEVQEGKHLVPTFLFGPRGEFIQGQFKMESRNELVRLDSPCIQAPQKQRPPCVVLRQDDNRADRLLRQLSDWTSRAAGTIDPLGRIQSDSLYDPVRLRKLSNFFVRQQASYVRELQSAVRQGRITSANALRQWLDAWNDAVVVRAELLKRQPLPDLDRAIVQGLDPITEVLEESRSSLRRIESRLLTMSPVQRRQAFGTFFERLNIDVRKATRTSLKSIMVKDKWAKRLARIGRTAGLVGNILTVADIALATDKVQATRRAAIELGSSALAIGVVGPLAAGAVCGPGFLVCTAGILIVSGSAGVVLGEWANSAVDATEVDQTIRDVMGAVGEILDESVEWVYQQLFSE